LLFARCGELELDHQRLGQIHADAQRLCTIRPIQLAIGCDEFSEQRPGHVAIAKADEREPRCDLGACSAELPYKRFLRDLRPALACAVQWAVRPEQ
jgi:hypothetical protein